VSQCAHGINSSVIGRGIREGPSNLYNDLCLPKRQEMLLAQDSKAPAQYFFTFCQVFFFFFSDIEAYRRTWRPGEPPTTGTPPQGAKAQAAPGSTQRRQDRDREHPAGACRRKLQQESAITGQQRARTSCLRHHAAKHPPRRQAAKHPPQNQRPTASSPRNRDNTAPQTGGTETPPTQRTESNTAKATLPETKPQSVREAPPPEPTPKQPLPTSHVHARRLDDRGQRGARGLSCCGTSWTAPTGDQPVGQCRRRGELTLPRRPLARLPPSSVHQRPPGTRLDSGQPAYPNSALPLSRHRWPQPQKPPPTANPARA
jgi:hypothetical protein